MPSITEKTASYICFSKADGCAWAHTESQSCILSMCLGCHS